MPRQASEDDEDLNDRPRVLRTSASNSKPPATSAASSVFALGQAAKPADPPAPKRAAPDVFDPDAIEIKTDVPLPPVHNARSVASQYAALYQRMAPGAMVELPQRQAKAFGAWAKKLPDGKAKLALRKLGKDSFGVWRLS